MSITQHFICVGGMNGYCAIIEMPSPVASLLESYFERKVDTEIRRVTIGGFGEEKLGKKLAKLRKSKITRSTIVDLQSEELATGAMVTEFEEMKTRLKQLSKCEWIQGADLVRARGKNAEQDGK